MLHFTVKMWATDRVEMAHSFNPNNREAEADDLCEFNRETLSWTNKKKNEKVILLPGELFI